MKYWFTIKEALPEDVALKIWNRISNYRVNMTVLFDRAYIYGDATEATAVFIENALLDTGYSIERG